MDSAASPPAKSHSALLEAHWPIEARVMMHCLRARYNEERAADLPRTLRAEPGRDELSWLRLVTLASLNAVVPLLHLSLQRAEQSETKGEPTDAPQSLEPLEPLIADEMRAALAASMRRNISHTLKLTRELLAVAQVFESANLPYAPFKGPLLAEEAYGGLGMRQFSDLDILVRHKDVLHIKRLMQQRGYIVEDPLPPAIEAAHLQGDIVYEMSRGDGAYNLELQWAVVVRSLPFCFRFESLEARLRRVRLAGAEVPTIAPEELLLILCVHGTKHVWGRLGWICDVAEVLRSNQELDWQHIFDLAKRLRCRKMLALGLFLAREMLGQTLSPAAAAWLETQKGTALLASEVQTRFSQSFTSKNEGEEPERIGNVSEDTFFLRNLETRGDQCRYLWHLVSVPNAKERARLPLPASLAFLWRVIRPTQLMVKYAGVGLRKVTGRR